MCPDSGPACLATTAPAQRPHCQSQQCPTPVPLEGEYAAHHGHGIELQERRSRDGTANIAPAQPLRQPLPPADSC